jgi:hypothetical protein
MASGSRKVLRARTVHAGGGDFVRADARRLPPGRNHRDSPDTQYRLRFFQESRIQATFDVLKSRLALNACVRRDGAWSMIPAAQLVPGDIIKLSLGMVVSADARVIDGNVLLSQSMLTGEPLLVQISHVVGGPA